MRIFIGSVLFCIFARARWGDHQGIEKLILDLDDNGGGFIQGNTSQFKTGTTAKQKTMFVRLTAPLWNFLGSDYPNWWTVWINLREEHQMLHAPDKAFMPAPSDDGGWCDRELSAGEATEWIREVFMQ